jgi:AcrR family transcriptional regulator
MGTEKVGKGQDRGRSQPRGREAVRDALIDAAERLCAEQSPGQVSVRQIAAEAGVNQGQVHHYFGSKEALIAATMERIEAALIDRIDSAGPDAGLSGLVEVAVDRPAFVRMIAWIVIEGRDPSVFAGLRFGGELGERLRIAGWSEAEATVLVAQVMAIAGGWALFNPAIAASNELDATDVRRTQESLQRLVELLVAMPAQAPDSADRHLSLGPGSGLDASDPKD